jgi:hypothetical protein
MRLMCRLDQHEERNGHSKAKRGRSSHTAQVSRRRIGGRIFGSLHPIM